MNKRGVLAMVCLIQSVSCSEASLLDVSVRGEAIRHGERDVADRMVVAIEYEERSIECSGTLISATNVLTAAHCFAGVDVSQLGVVAEAGAKYAIRARAAHIHPDFDLESLTADLGVLELEEPMLGVSPLPVALGAAIEDGADALIVGFGMTGEADPTTTRERRSGVASISAVEDETFELSAAPALPCNGDSGGAVILPLEGQAALFGVISHGDPLCNHGAVAVRTDAFASFLVPFVATRATPQQALRASSSRPSACTISPERMRCAPRWLLGCLYIVLAWRRQTRLGAGTREPRKRADARASGRRCKEATSQ